MVTEGNYPCEFLIGELEDLSTEVVTLVTGQDIVAGTVLGQIFTATIDRTGATGNGTISAVTPGAAMTEGRYTATFTTTGATATANVTAPDGRYLGVLTVGTAFVCDHLSVTFSDGATDFDNNDVVFWDVTSKYSLHNNAGTDGSQYAQAISYGDYDATAADMSIVVVARMAEVNADKLTWKNGISAVNKATAIKALANKFIFVRS
jgi:hypothetical protein